jgi:hypothetical protein
VKFFLESISKDLTQIVSDHGKGLDYRVRESLENADMLIRIAVHTQERIDSKEIVIQLEKPSKQIGGVLKKNTTDRRREG